MELFCSIEIKGGLFYEKTFTDYDRIYHIFLFRICHGFYRD
jgi:hypothetical protein